MLNIFTGNALADNKKIIDSRIYSKITDSFDLSSKDLSLYKEIFEAANEDQWHKVDKRAEKLNNDILLGHILAKKYLSKSYKSSYQELVDWLEKYTDYPQYYRIYRLAGIKGDKSALSDSLAYSGTLTQASSGYSWYLDDMGNISNANKKYILEKVKSFRKHINSGKSKLARGILEDAKFRKVVPNKSWDAMAATLATLYFTDNYDKLALEWSKKPASRSKNSIAHWFGGLAAWRLKDYKTAAKMFDQLSHLDISDDWMLSSGGYWAYRSYNKLGLDNKAKASLKEASKYKRTFYGILASSQLDEKITCNWNSSSYINDFSKSDYVDSILSSPSLKRAVLLGSIGEKKLAASEIMFAYKDYDNAQKEIALFIAAQYEIHNVAITISNNLKDIQNEIYYDGLAYPLPNWNKKVWNANKPLILALIRQESAFHAEAVSSAGARGLMQVMPNTAYHVTKDATVKKNSSKLLNPEYNMEVGQKYINYLLEKPFIEGNLFYLLTAYNAGPGNLLKWKKKTNYMNDPLLFMESIPSRETRLYIKRVMTNYWVYSLRLEEDAPSLTQLPKSLWPTM